MSELRPKPLKIEIGGKEYGLLFNLNAIDEIQDQLDLPLSRLYEAMSDERKVFKILRTMLTVMINEAIDEEGGERVTEKFIGRKINPLDIQKLKNSVFTAFTQSMPEADDPNAESE